MREKALLACAGVALVASQVALIWLTRDLTHATATTIASVVPLALGLAVPTALLLLMAPRLGRVPPSRATLVVVFLSGLALRAIWLGSPAPLEDDFQRYLWDGAVTAHGLNPYAHAPERFLSSDGIPLGYEAIAMAGRGTIESINFPDLRTIYPSTAQLAFALGYVIAPFKIDGLRLVFLTAEIATFLLLLAALAEIRASPLWSALYWWNPTVSFVLVGLAHVDALVPPFVLGAILLASRDRIGAAVALLGVAAGVKIWPMLLVPLVLARIRKEPARLAATGVLLAAVVAFAVGPVALAALQPNSGLTEYATSWANNNAFFAWAAYVLEETVEGMTGDDTAAPLLRAASALAGVITAMIVAVRAGTNAADLMRGGMIIAGTVFYLSPAQFPWYAVWFLPLAAILRSWPLLLASATLPTYYLFFPLWSTEHEDTLVYGAAFLHSVPVLGWLAADALWRWWMQRGAARTIEP